MITLAVDPGKHASGWALFSDAGLVAAGFDSPKFFAIDQIVMEVPRIRRLGKSKGDPNDLVEVAISVGEWFGVHAEADRHRYYPAQWKGQLPKPECRARAHAVLSPTELASVPKVAMTRGGTDMWDAIALGLVHLERLRMR